MNENQQKNIQEEVLNIKLGMKNILILLQEISQNQIALLKTQNLILEKLKDNFPV